jgi:hypothetical protein
MMMLAAILLLQAAQPAPALPPAQAPVSLAPPEIQLDFRATARRVVIDNRGEASLTLQTSANGAQGEGNIVDIQAPELPQGRRELDNVEVRVRAEARIADPRAERAAEQEPPAPQ